VVELGQAPLWLDEGFTLLQATYRPVSDWSADVHPPLYYALLWAWTHVSTGDAWLRLPSALLGAATVPAVYALGARLHGRAAGLWAAAFMGATWFHVWHSREARMYSLLVLGFALALWGLIAGARDGSRAGWVVYALAGAAMAWSHAIGVYYAAIVAGLALAVPRGDGRARLGRPWLAAAAGMAILFAPWLPVAAARTRATVEHYWIRPAGAEPFLTALHDLTVAPIYPPAALLRSVLGVDPGPVAAQVLGAWLWSAPLLAAIALAVARAEPAARWAIRFLVLAYAAPIALFAVLSLLVRPILIPRILLPVAVPLALLLAAGVQAVPWRRARAGAGLAIALVLLLGTAYGFRRDAGHREDWRAAAHHVRAAARDGDVLLFAMSSMEQVPAASERSRSLTTHEMLLLRYDESGRLAALPRLAVPRVTYRCPGDIGSCLDAALRDAGAAAGTHVWLVARQRGMLLELRRWSESRLEPGQPREFNHVYVERRRLRP
jgi:mannosyltransferase